MFYKKSIKEVIKSLNSSLNGLSKADAKERIKTYGYNELKEKEKTSTLKLFLETFKDPLVIILLIAALIQVFLGEVVESSIILAVVTLNAILSVVQSKKDSGSSPHARSSVYRGGNGSVHFLRQAKMFHLHSDSGRAAVRCPASDRQGLRRHPFQGSD